MLYISQSSLLNIVQIYVRHSEEQPVYAFLRCGEHQLVKSENPSLGTAMEEDDAMAEIMTASANTSVKTITDNQIDEITNRFRDALRKQRNEMPSEIVQSVLGIDNLGVRLLAPFRAFLRTQSNLLVCRVMVAERPFEAALEATGRKLYINRLVLERMPLVRKGETEVFFFKLKLNGGSITDDMLEKEYELRELKPANPYAQAAVNEAQPNFAHEHPNFTHWKDPKKGWCHVTFDQWNSSPDVVVGRSEEDLYDHLWFAGERK